MEGANLNFNDMDFDLSFGSEFAQPAAQMPVQPYMKPAEGNTSDFLLFPGDEGIDTSGSAFIGTGAAQQSFDSMTTADLFSFSQDTGFGLQQNLNMDNTMGTSWNNQLPSAINDFSQTPAQAQAFASSHFGSSVQKRPLQLDTQDFPQPKRQERADFATFSPFAPSTSVTGSSWTIETQPTPTSSTEVGLSDEAADVCATWFSKYGMLPGDRHIESLSQLTDESPTAIRHWFGQMLKQGMSGHDSAYKSQTRLTQQDQPTSTSTGWIDASPTQPCNNDATTTAGQSAPRGGKKGCTPTNKHELLCRDPNKIYQCTRKCGKRYGRKCDWKRNEEEGYPSKSWQCSLCVSQGVEKVKPCFRRYHFSQHFRNIHPGLNSADYEETSVVHSDTTFPRKCGFCTHRFVSRQDRIDHIADHFKKGKCMLDWVDDDDNNNDSDDHDDDDDRPDSDGFDSNSPSNSPQDKDSQGRQGQRRNGNGGSGGNLSSDSHRQLPGGYSQFNLSESDVSSGPDCNNTMTLPTTTEDLTTSYLNGSKAAEQHIKSSNTDNRSEERLEIPQHGNIDSRQQFQASAVEHFKRGFLPSPPGSCDPCSISGNNEAAGGDQIPVARNAVTVINYARPCYSTLPTSLSDLKTGDPGKQWEDGHGSDGESRGSDQLTGKSDSNRNAVTDPMLDPPDGLPPNIAAATDSLQDFSPEPTDSSGEKVATSSSPNSTSQSYWREINDNGIDLGTTFEGVAFKSVKLLGAGGFSTVDEVVHRETNLRVSRKTLKNRNASAKEELMKEVGVLQKLRHPHIVRFLGAYAKGDKVSVLLSPVAETTLAIWLEKATTRKFDGLGDVIAKMYGCLSSTVRYLHEQRPVIKHMDIKPQNILVMHGDSDHPHVVLSDFGISSTDGESEGPHSKPVTRQYCAPEVPEDAVRGQAADIWSLGCVFLEMAAVVLTQHNQSWQQLRQEFRGTGGKCYWEDVPRLQEYLSDFVSHAPAPQDVVALCTIQSMLNRNPVDRPNAAQLTIIFTPGSCCLQWPNENVAFPGPVEELGTVEMLIREDSVDCLAQLDHCSGIELRQDAQSFTQAKSWLDECSNGHESCQPSSTSHSLPTRLIDCQPAGNDNSTVRIIESSEILANAPGGTVDVVKYAALSHRWNQTDVTLSSDLMRDTQGSLNREALPKAVNDAITAANMIGIRYIWADSLCILQDSEQDIRRECANMASVYRNAAITIVVNKTNQEGVAKNIDETVPSTSQDTLLFGGDLPLMHWNATGFAWDTRAWTLQERLLSHRLLHLAGEQMYWECNSLKASETFPRGLPPLIWEKVHTKSSEPREEGGARGHACSDCQSKLKKQSDIAKHEKTHSRSWKCTKCKYFDVGSPSNSKKERGRHVHDIHSAEVHHQDVKSKMQEVGNMKLGSPNVGGDGLRNYENAFSPHDDLVNTPLASDSSTHVSPRFHSTWSGCTDHNRSNTWDKETMTSEDVLKVKFEFVLPAEADVNLGMVGEMSHGSGQENVNEDVVMKRDNGLEVELVNGGDGPIVTGCHNTQPCVIGSSGSGCEI